jgi:hypothetical protein
LKQLDDSKNENPIWYYKNWEDIPGAQYDLGSVYSINKLKLYTCGDSNSLRGAAVYVTTSPSGPYDSSTLATVVSDVPDGGLILNTSFAARNGRYITFMFTQHSQSGDVICVSECQVFGTEGAVTGSSTITVNADPTEGGSVTGGGTFNNGTTTTITAKANKGYIFTQWNDGNTEKTRTITVSENITYTANFVVDENPNILLDNQNVKLVRIEHPMDWSATKPLTYDPVTMRIMNLSGNEARAKTVWTDGDLAEPSPSLEIDNTSQQFNMRIGVLYDLGGFYEPSSIDICSTEAIVKAGRSNISISVYGGAFEDSSILENRIGYGGSKDKAINSISLSSKVSVRYILIMFEKMGSDSWCTDKCVGKDHTKDCTPVPGADRYVQWSNGAIYVTEIRMFGNEAEDPTTTKEYEDTSTGITISVISNGVTPIDEIKITKNELTDLQKADVRSYDLFAPNGLYHVEFFDVDGKRITDMNNRTITISIPLVYGDEVFAYYSEDEGVIVVDAEIDMDTNSMSYTFVDLFSGKILMLSMSDSETPGGSPNNDSPDTGVKNSLLVLIFIILSAVCLTVVKTPKTLNQWRKIHD